MPLTRNRARSFIRLYCGAGALPDFAVRCVHPNWPFEQVAAGLAVLAGTTKKVARARQIPHNLCLKSFQFFTPAKSGGRERNEQPDEHRSAPPKTNTHPIGPDPVRNYCAAA